MNERLVVAGKQQPARLLLKAHGPFKRIDCVPSPGVRVQVVHQVPAADNENAFFPQGRQALTNFVVKRGRLGLVNAQLNDGNVSLGIDMTQHRPRPMVQSPALIQFDRERR